MQIPQNYEIILVGFWFSNLLYCLESVFVLLELGTLSALQRDFYIDTTNTIIMIWLLTFSKVFVFIVYLLPSRKKKIKMSTLSNRKICEYTRKQSETVWQNVKRKTIVAHASIVSTVRLLLLLLLLTVAASLKWR